MREVKQRRRFRQDFKVLSAGIHRRILEEGGELWEVVDILAADMFLDPKYQDHPLRGRWEGCRECHIRPDLLLVYRYEGVDLLYLERLNSHANIFGL